MSGRADGERRVNTIRCWFAGAGGKCLRAHEIFGEHVRVNGFAAGVPDLAKNMRTACEFP